MQPHPLPLTAFRCLVPADGFVHGASRRARQRTDWSPAGAGPRTRGTATCDERFRLRTLRPSARSGHRDSEPPRSAQLTGRRPAHRFLCQRSQSRPRAKALWRFTGWFRATSRHPVWSAPARRPARSAVETMQRHPEAVVEPRRVLSCTVVDSSSPERDRFQCTGRVGSGEDTQPRCRCWEGILGLKEQDWAWSSEAWPPAWGVAFQVGNRRAERQQSRGALCRGPQANWTPLGLEKLFKPPRAGPEAATDRPSAGTTPHRLLTHDQTAAGCATLRAANKPSCWRCQSATPAPSEWTQPGLAREFDQDKQTSRGGTDQRLSQGPPPPSSGARVLGRCWR